MFKVDVLSLILHARFCKMNVLRVLCRDQFQSYWTRSLSTTLVANAKKDPPKDKKKNITPPAKDKKKTFKKPQKTAIFNTAPDAAFHELPIVLVRATQNNTLVYLSDHLGTMKYWTSAGIQGFKNANRGSSYAGKVAADVVGKRAVDLGLQNVRVKLNGIGPGRKEAVMGLVATGLKIVSLTDVTPVPHNGPKPRKARRL